MVGFLFYSFGKNPNLLEGQTTEDSITIDGREYNNLGITYIAFKEGEDKVSSKCPDGHNKFKSDREGYSKCGSFEAYEAYEKQMGKTKAPTPQKTCNPAIKEKPAVFKIGEPLEARFTTPEDPYSYYPGKISNINCSKVITTYDIKFDDGDERKNLPESSFRKITE